MPDEGESEPAPASPAKAKFNTGKLPNPKSEEGKPRLLLVGQRRYTMTHEGRRFHLDSFVCSRTQVEGKQEDMLMLIGAHVPF
jgi:hypothetical protein